MRIDEQVYIEKLGKEFVSSTKTETMTVDKIENYLMRQAMETYCVYVDDDYDNEMYGQDFCKRVRKETDKETLSHKYTFKTGYDKERELQFYKEVSFKKAS